MSFNIYDYIAIQPLSIRQKASPPYRVYAEMQCPTCKAIFKMQVYKKCLCGNQFYKIEDYRGYHYEVALKKEKNHE